MSETVGAIVGLWRFPVKSMLGERLDTAEVAEGGLLGDRAYALIDVQTGKVVSAKNPKLGPALFGCRAAFVELPQAGEELPAARITFPDGTTVTSDAPDADATISGFLGCDVRLARAAPEDFTIDQYHPDQEDLDPQGHRDEVTETKLGNALFNEVGMPSPLPEGSFLDVFPVSVITTSALDHLGELQPGSTFDVRRFRMNVIVATSAEGFVENSWIGGAIDVGEHVKLAVSVPDPRCVMTTVAQEGLERDPQVLKALAKHNRLDFAGAGLYPCAGVYAVVASSGTIRTGDPVTPS
jgi:uncharacterized protein